MMIRLLVTLFAALATMYGSLAHAQYPKQPITMIIPFAAGGPTDTVGRLLGQAMGTDLKQTVIIENVGGAGGTVAAGRVARSDPDGYTLLLHHIGHSTAPALYRKLPYNAIDDFVPIGLVTDAPMTLVARADFPPKDLKEMIEYVKKNKDKVTLANAGLGAASHLCGLLLQSTLKIDMQTVPYKGTAPAMNDLLGGQVDLMCDQTTNTTGQIESGRVKAFGVTSSKRLATPALKNLPTLDEAGVKGFNVNIWHGLYAPKGTPKAVVDKLNTALRAALKDADFIKREEALGAVVITDARLGGAEHKKFVESEIAKWGPIIKAAGQYAD